MEICNLHASFSNCPCQTQSGGSSSVCNVATLTQTETAPCSLCLAQIFFFSKLCPLFYAFKALGIQIA